MPSVVLLLTAGSAIVWIIIDYLNHRYEIADERVVRTEIGIVKRTVRHKPLSKNATVEYQQSLIGRFLNYGDVVTWTEDPNAPVAWPRISNPKRVVQFIEQLRDKNATADKRTTSSTLDQRQSENANSSLIAHTNIDLKFLDSSEKETHLARFRATSGDGTSPAISPETKTWEVVNEWEASHHVPKRGDGKRQNRPQVLAWHPQGGYLAVTCDAFGLSVYEENGRKVGGGTEDSAYGESKQIYWSSDGNLVVATGDTSRNTYWLFCSGYGEPLSIVRNLPGPIGAEWDINHNYCKGRMTTPFRPGSREILIAPFNINSIALFNIDQFGKSWRNPKSIYDFSPQSTLSLDHLGAQNNSCMRYHWHPSGLYLALSAGPNKSQYYSTSAHVIEFDTGKIITSFTGGFRELGWSPAGRFLLLELPVDISAGRHSPSYKLWDAHTDDVVELSSISDVGAWARVLASAAGQGASPINAVGDRIFQHLTPHPDNQDALIVKNITRENQTTELIMEPSRFAAWHPTDPDKFAAIALCESGWRVRIWRAS